MNDKCSTSLNCGSNAIFYLLFQQQGKREYGNIDMDFCDDILWKYYEKWLRIMTLVHYGGKKICYNLLHSKESLPTDGGELYVYLTFWRKDIKPDRSQAEVLYPANEITDETNFDISLYTRIIQGIYGEKYRRLLQDLRKLRNSEFHRGKIQLTPVEFEEIWAHALNTLGSHDFDVDSVAGLKDCNFSPPQEYAESLMNFIQDCIQGSVESFIFFCHVIYMDTLYVGSRLRIYFHLGNKSSILSISFFLQSNF